MDYQSSDYPDLGRHTIDKIEYYSARTVYPRLLAMNAIKGYHGFGPTAWIAVIRTSAGAAGWGTLCRDIVSAREVESLLLGKHLNEVFATDTGILLKELLPFDIALHDLAGRILEMPVSKMINPDAVSRVRAYDGAVYMNDLIPYSRNGGVERVLLDCEHDYCAGHRSMKIKIGRGNMWMDARPGMSRDIEVVKQVHRAFPDVALLVDANDGYTVDDTINFLEGVRNVPLYWVEEPFRESVKDYSALCEYLRLNRPGTLIADGESPTDISLLFDLAKRKLLDVWMPDVCDYGFTAWRNLLKEIVPLGYLASPHAWGEVLKTNCCLHLAAAYPQHIPIVETVLGYTEGVESEGYALSEGFFTLPSKPGFGMELVWAPPA